MDFKFRTSRRRVVDKSEDELLEDKIKKLFDGEPLFERLHSEPKWQRSRAVYKKSISGAKRGALYVNKQPMLVKVISVVILSLGVGGMYQFTHKNPEQPVDVSVVAGTADPVVERLAQQNENSANTATGGLPRETPSFDLLIPSDKSYKDFDIVRLSPASNEPVYAYIDKIESVDINISEQKVPEQFNYNQDVELERVAREFQATDVIQIDGIMVYYGLSDELKVQSIIFIKNDLLVFIKSPQKLSDDTWAGYITNLKKP